MLELVIATHNRDKLKEIKNLLNNLPIKVFSLDDFPGAPVTEEDGKTLRSNAIKKAKAIAEFTGKLSLADDSGLEVNFLGGQPGVYSSRFAGSGCSYADNNKKLLRLMKTVLQTKRQARFRCVMALVWTNGQTKTVEGRCNGYIADSIRGTTGFGYDPVFIVPEYGKTFAELGLEIKNTISHRARALVKVKKILSK